MLTKKGLYEECSREGVKMPKRVGNVFWKAKDPDFVRNVILKSLSKKKNRKVVERIYKNLDSRVERLCRMAEEHSFNPAPYREITIFDISSQKERSLRMHKLFPDSLYMSVLAEIAKPMLLRGVDSGACASIKGRGQSMAKKIIEKQLHKSKQAKYCFQGDVRHFYDNIIISKFMEMFRTVCKDEEFLSEYEKCLRATSADGEHGIGIGSPMGHDVGNFYLQRIDESIHSKPKEVKAYVRYMDNFTIIGPNKRKLHRLTESIIQKLTPLGLWLKDDWQIFRIRTRNIEAVGYRFGFKATRFRKRTWKRMRRCILNLKRFIDSGIEIPKKMIRSYLSRVGQLKHTARRKIQVKYLAGIKRKELIRRLNTA